MSRLCFIIQRLHSTNVFRCSLMSEKNRGKREKMCLNVWAPLPKVPLKCRWTSQKHESRDSMTPCIFIDTIGRIPASNWLWVCLRFLFLFYFYHQSSWIEGNSFNSNPSLVHLWSFIQTDVSFASKTFVQGRKKLSIRKEIKQRTWLDCWCQVMLREERPVRKHSTSRVQILPLCTVVDYSGI